MNIYRISQSKNHGYDTYDAAIVAAPDEETARNIAPNGDGFTDWSDSNYAWARKPEQVTVELLGVATPGIEVGVLLASFNAG